MLFLQFLNEITEECDPVSWVLDTGKELERACEFAMALKYYFAGRMFFAQLKKYQQCRQLSVNRLVELKWKRLKYEREFQFLYDDLLPMTNAEASYSKYKRVHTEHAF